MKRLIFKKEVEKETEVNSGLKHYDCFSMQNIQPARESDTEGPEASIQHRGQELDTSRSSLRHGGMKCLQSSTNSTTEAY